MRLLYTKFLPWHVQIDIQQDSHASVTISEVVGDLESYPTGSNNCLEP